ncbi:MAG: glutathione S-transferase family protein [Acidobacteriota bacterium]
MLHLVIGNRNYSSWSLRAWLYLRASGIPFEETRLAMFTDGWEEAVARHSPAGRVPVLLDGGLAVWDTAAIFEHLRETRDDALDHPSDPAARALSRSICAEMHSGFFQVRDELPQNLRARTPLARASLSSSCRSQVDRIESIWSDCRERFGSGGPWLFGELSLADVLYAPVALRFVTYSIEVSDRARPFVEAVESDALIREWVTEAGEEPEAIDFIDDLTPAHESPLTLG